PAMVGTANLDWVLRVVGADVSQLESLLGSSSPGANGVAALSFLSSSGERAPFVEPNARGQFTGLSLDTTPGDLVRAMCEAVAYAARHNLEAAGLTGEVSACGGGARSTAWSQVFADVLGRPVHVPLEEGVGARGAAMAAWAALGDPVDHERWAAERRTVHPEPRAAEFYERGYRAGLQPPSAAPGPRTERCAAPRRRQFPQRTHSRTLEAERPLQTHRCPRSERSPCGTLACPPGPA